MENSDNSRHLPPRKTYKFSHSIGQGGYLFIWKAKEGCEIKNKTELRNQLNEVIQQFRLIDTTIKIYNSIFFLFFTFKPKIVLQQLIDSIVEKIQNTEEWDKESFCTATYDLQEQYVRKELQKYNFDYDKG